MTSDLSNNGYYKTFACKKAEISSLRDRILVIPLIKAGELKAPLNPPAMPLDVFQRGRGVLLGFLYPYTNMGNLDHA